MNGSVLANGLTWAAGAEFRKDETEFKAKLAGSAIYRIGHERWLRNIAVALGNETKGAVAVVAALKLRQNHESTLVREHVEWALSQHVMASSQSSVNQ